MRSATLKILRHSFADELAFKKLYKQVWDDFEKVLKLVKKFQQMLILQKHIVFKELYFYNAAQLPFSNFF